MFVRILSPARVHFLIPLLIQVERCWLILVVLYATAKTSVIDDVLMIVAVCYTRVYMDGRCPSENSVYLAVLPLAWGLKRPAWPGLAC